MRRVARSRSDIGSTASNAVRPTELAKGGCDWSLVERLVKGERLAEIEYRKQKCYLRRLAPTTGRPRGAS